MDISEIRSEFLKITSFEKEGSFSKNKTSENKIAGSEAGKYSNPDMDKLALSGAAEAQIDKTQKKAKWTVLIYAAGDNFLERAETTQLGEIEEVGSTENVNIAAQYDRSPGGAEETNRDAGEKYKSYPADAARYYLKKSSREKSNSSIEKLGKIDSADQKNLESFLKWGVEKYPAENYLIILKNHGGGFTGILSDESENSYMEIPDVRNAILNVMRETGLKREDVVLGLDACVMGQAEVAYELKDAARYMIASQKTGAIGWPYRSIFGLKEPVNEVQRMSSEEFEFSNQLENLNKEELAEKIIRSCEANRGMTPTMAVYDLNKMEDFKGKLDNFAKALLETQTPLEYLQREIENAQVFEEDKPYSDMRDVYSLAENLYLDKDIKDENLKKTCRDLMEAARNAVLLEEHKDSEKDEESGIESYEDAHGISFYFPVLGLMHGIYNYKDLALAKETMFDEAVTAISRKIQFKMQSEGK